MAAKQKQETNDQEQVEQVEPRTVADLPGNVVTQEREYKPANVSTLPEDLRGLTIAYTVPGGETWDDVVRSIAERLAGDTLDEKAPALRDTFEAADKLALQKVVKAAGEDEKTEAAMVTAAQDYRTTPKRTGGGGRVSVKARAAKAEAKAEAAGNEFLETIREFLDEDEPQLAQRVMARAEKAGIAIPQDLRDELEAALA